MSKALLYDSFKSGIRLATLPMPKITAPGQCLVRMLAAPINPSDANQVTGTYALKPETFPAVGGNEGVGVIEEVGEEVTGLKTGDMVIPSTPLLGTWRQWLVAEQTSLFPVSKDLSIEAAATLAVNPPTAYLLLESTKPLAVLQNGANSAVGRLVIQMAAIQGRRIFNLIRPREDFELVKRELEGLGRGRASVFSSATKFDELKSAIEAGVGFNCVGGEAVGLMSKILPDGAEIITYGGMSGRPVVMPTTALIFRAQRCTGFWLSAWKAGQGKEEMSRVLGQCERMFLDGQITTAPIQRISIDQVTSADLSGPKKLIIF